MHQRLGGFFIKVHYSWTRIIIYTDFVPTLPCPVLIVFAFRSARGTYKAVLPVLDSLLWGLTILISLTKIANQSIGPHRSQHILLTLFSVPKNE